MDLSSAFLRPQHFSLSPQIFQTSSLCSMSTISNCSTTRNLLYCLFVYINPRNGGYRPSRLNSAFQEPTCFFPAEVTSGEAGHSIIAVTPVIQPNSEISMSTGMRRETEVRVRSGATCWRGPKERQLSTGWWEHSRK